MSKHNKIVEITADEADMFEIIEEKPLKRLLKPTTVKKEESPPILVVESEESAPILVVEGEENNDDNKYFPTPNENEIELEEKFDGMKLKYIMQIMTLMYIVCIILIIALHARYVVT